MAYDQEIDKLMDAIIDVSQKGVPVNMIIRSLIKSLAEVKCDTDTLREEFEEFKKEYQESQEDEDDDE